MEQFEADAIDIGVSPVNNKFEDIFIDTSKEVFNVKPKNFVDLNKKGMIGNVFIIKEKVCHTFRSPSQT